MQTFARNLLFDSYPAFAYLYIQLNMYKIKRLLSFRMVVHLILYSSIRQIITY